MRSYYPDCGVWLNGRALVPTDKEVEAYQLNVTKILANEHKARAQHIGDDEDEIPPTVLHKPELEPELTVEHTMLFDPSMFEADSDF